MSIYLSINNSLKCPLLKVFKIIERLFSFG
jgi:hypothetical protein